MSFHRTLEMTISREEFLRLLAAVGPFEADGDTLRSPGPGRAWAIRLVALPCGQVGRVSVPRHRVEIVLEGDSEAEHASFMARFTRGFLRGGG
ncbi:MAG: hypothetical protein H6Q10_3667 [Acidobacteria bacterium]|jgi:hypothetical protein|nr:hypothetical protein [Acidobacteriota bacterium]